MRTCDHHWGPWKNYFKDNKQLGQVRTCSNCKGREFMCTDDFRMMLPPEKDNGNEDRLENPK